MIAQVRIARATDRLNQILCFYRDGIGLPMLGGFEDHAGYDGVIVGLPGADRQLEFTQHVNPVHRSPPGGDDLLVLYYVDAAERDAVVARLASLGFAPVPPENPFWNDSGVTVPDPDVFRVVLFAGQFVPGHLPARFAKGSST